MIDKIGIAAATRAAMVEAVTALCVSPDHLLIDWVKLPQVSLPQICVPKADQRMASVAAASILAKVTRDQLLERLSEQYPLYDFHAHKGYGTAHHLAMLEAHGPCAEHRHSFAPIAARPGLWDAAV
jgi:ribonuclease HII